MPGSSTPARSRKKKAMPIWAATPPLRPTSLYDKDVGRATSRTRAGAKDRRGTARPDFLMRCAFGTWPKPSARPSLTFIGREPPRFTSGSRRVGVLITADFEPADLVAVHFVRPIGEAQETRRRERGCEEMIVRGAPAAKELDGPVDDLLRHVGRDNLDHRDFLTSSLVADTVHHVRSFEGEKARLLDHDPRL